MSVRGLVRGRLAQGGRLVSLSRTNAHRACPIVAAGTTGPIDPIPRRLLGFEHGLDCEDSSDGRGISDGDCW